MPKAGNYLFFVLLSKLSLGTYAQSKKCDLAPLKIGKTDTYILFTIQDVKADTLTLRQYKYDSVFQNKLQNNIDTGHKWLFSSSGGHMVKDTLAEEKLSTLCMSTKPYLLAHARSNALIDVLSFAYAHHRPVSLSPDVIWLTIMQGLAIHINQNSEALRKKILDFESKRNLYVEVDSDFDTHSVLQWSDVMGQFNYKIKSIWEPALLVSQAVASLPRPSKTKSPSTLQ